MTDQQSLTTASEAALAEADELLHMAKLIKYDDLRRYCIGQITTAPDADELRAANAFVRNVLKKRRFSEKAQGGRKGHTRRMPPASPFTGPILRQPT